MDIKDIDWTRWSEFLEQERVIYGEVSLSDFLRAVRYVEFLGYRVKIEVVK